MCVVLAIDAVLAVWSPLSWLAALVEVVRVLVMVTVVVTVFTAVVVPPPRPLPLTVLDGVPLTALSPPLSASGTSVAATMRATMTATIWDTEGTSLPRSSGYHRL